MIFLKDSFDIQVKVLYSKNKKLVNVGQRFSIGFKLDIFVTFIKR